MTDLDDSAALRAADPGRMLDVVMRLPEQCREGYALGLAIADPPAIDDLASVAFCGMGGSAIAGDVIRTLFAGELGVPVTVVRSAELPAHCGPRTLVLVSSYSGGTGETLALFERAVERGCRIVAVTSGGALADRAGELRVATLRLPAGFAMPRAAFGHLALGSIGVLVAMGLVRSVERDLDEAVAALEPIAARCGPSVPASDNPAKTLAMQLGERVPVIWGAAGIASAAATRWKAGFNENAKVPAFSSELPELDHNEVVGWSPGRGEGFHVIALRHDGEPRDLAARFALSRDIAMASGAGLEEVRTHASSALARLLDLVLRGDLTTTYLALARGIDPSPIEAIARLKAALAEAR